jgi:hypothetical protein
MRHAPPGSRRFGACVCGDQSGDAAAENIDPVHGQSFPAASSVSNLTTQQRAVL